MSSARGVLLLNATLVARFDGIPILKSSRNAAAGKNCVKGELGTRRSTSAVVLIRAEQNEAANHPNNMNETETEVAVAEMPLPESHRELELLLEALHALNDALDHYEAEATLRPT